MKRPRQHIGEIIYADTLAEIKLESEKQIAEYEAKGFNIESVNIVYGPDVLGYPKYQAMIMYYEFIDDSQYPFRICQRCPGFKLRPKNC